MLLVFLLCQDLHSQSFSCLEAPTLSDLTQSLCHIHTHSCAFSLNIQLSY